MTEKKPLSSAIEFSFHETPVAQAEGGSLHEHAAARGGTDEDDRAEHRRQALSQH